MAIPGARKDFAMNDYEYTFRQDVKEKKAIARNAFCKKSGAKSKKVTLPHEFLTKKELEAMNGEVRTIQLGKPMTWEELRTLDNDLQERYLQMLIDGYYASTKEIANMLKTTRGTLTSHISRNKLNVRFKRGAQAQQRTAEQREAWRIFCNGGVEKAEDTYEDETPNVTWLPMSFDVFKNVLSRSNKQEYLTYIRQTFGVGLTSVAHMMGVDRYNLYNYLEEESVCLNYIFKGPSEPTEKQQEAWREFCAKGSGNAEPEANEPIAETPGVNSLSSFRLSFKGNTTLEEITSAIRCLMGTDTLNGEINILFSC